MRGNKSGRFRNSLAHQDLIPIGGLPDFSALKFTKYNQYESLILPMVKYLEAAGVTFQYNTEVTNVLFEINGGKKVATAIECKVNGQQETIPLTENDLVFVNFCVIPAEEGKGLFVSRLIK